MSNILICKHCNKQMDVKQFGRHLWKIHNQRYKDYVKENILDFNHLGWKLCSKCGELCHSTSDKCGKCYTSDFNIKSDQHIHCKYCDRNIHSKGFPKHLKLNHNVNFSDYIKNNLNEFEKFGWCKCYICGNITKKRGKGLQETVCSNKCKSEYKKTLVGKKSTRFGAILSEESKSKISEKNKRYYSNPKNHPFYGKSLSDEHKKKQSMTRIKLGLSDGKNNPMYGKTHTPEAIRKIFSHRKMNKLEKMVADELDKAKIDYHFQYFINDGELCKSYDFKIKDKPLIIEVDGDFWHGNPSKPNHYDKVNEIRNNDKMKDELAYKHGLKVVRLWETDIKNDPSIVLKHIY